MPQKPALHPYPKSKGINRPTVVFDVRDALVYRFCIEQLDDELITTTRGNPNIRGGIKISPNTDPSGDGYYEKFFHDWMEHNEAIRQGLAERPIAASTDIASYFEGINISLLIDLVRSAVSGKPGVVTLLQFFLAQLKGPVRLRVEHGHRRPARGHRLLKDARVLLSAPTRRPPS